MEAEKYNSGALLTSAPESDADYAWFAPESVAGGVVWLVKPRVAEPSNRPADWTYLPASLNGAGALPAGADMEEFAAPLAALRGIFARPPSQDFAALQELFAYTDGRLCIYADGVPGYSCVAATKGGFHRKGKNEDALIGVSAHHTPDIAHILTHELFHNANPNADGIFPLAAFLEREALKNMCSDPHLVSYKHSRLFGYSKEAFHREMFAELGATHLDGDSLRKAAPLTAATIDLEVMLARLTVVSEERAQLFADRIMAMVNSLDIVSDLNRVLRARKRIDDRSGEARYAIACERLESRRPELTERLAGGMADGLAFGRSLLPAAPPAALARARAAFQGRGRG
ncbi:hypothetical protein FACS1894186_2060 [Alphaproteobacteria bacterium]|nr:hypothetical protein FACS1894186_2060 [Alphaproteobacteria bacterium]